MIDNHRNSGDMKTQSMVVTILAAALAGVGLAEQEAEVQFRTNVSHDDLVAVQKRQMAAGGDPIHGVTPIEKADFKQIEAPGDILDRSDFITANGLVTLVPKRAILHIPAEYKENIKASAEARLVSWAEFLVANRGWIETYEVTRKQAEGKREIAEERWANFTESKKLVVATLLGGPISVLPPHVEDAVEPALQEE